MQEKDQYIVELPTGDVIWITLDEKRMLSDYGYIFYDSIKNYWWFKTSRRFDIEHVLNFERKMAKIYKS
jgi:hypothetical protein